MSYIKFNVNPIDSHQTLVNEYKARGTSFLGFILFMGNIFCLVTSIFSIVELFKNFDYKDFIKPLIWILCMVLFDGLLVVFLSSNLKSAFLNLCLYLLLTISLLVGIFGCAQLYNNINWGILTLVISVVMIFLFILLKIIKHRKDNHMNTHLFKDTQDIDI